MDYVAKQAEYQAKLIDLEVQLCEISENDEVSRAALNKKVETYTRALEKLQLLQITSSAPAPLTLQPQSSYSSTTSFFSPHSSHFASAHSPSIIFEKELNDMQLINDGNFGLVYRANFQGQRVVVKCPKHPTTGLLIFCDILSCLTL